MYLVYVYEKMKTRMCGRLGSGGGGECSAQIKAANVYGVNPLDVSLGLETGFSLQHICWEAT
jgi:hypothetical protein